MVPGLASSAEPQGWRSHPDGDAINKGFLAERGHLGNSGTVKIQVSAFALTRYAMFFFLTQSSVSMSDLSSRTFETCPSESQQFLCD